MRNLKRSNVPVTCALFIAISAAAVFAGDEKAPATSQPVATSPTTAAEQASASKAQIQSLIHDLGSPQYTTRRAAANDLRRIGADAFDALFAATDDADPEVAASASYLLRQINVRWTQNDDSATVRRMMRSYGDLPDDARIRLVADISKLANRDGLAALCRIVRYDRSPLISRAAALAVIRPDVPDVRHTPVDQATIDRELGDSGRATATWIRQFQAQLRDPAASIGPWQRIIDEEAARLAQRRRNQARDSSRPALEPGRNLPRAQRPPGPAADRRSHRQSRNERSGARCRRNPGLARRREVLGRGR